MHLQAKPDFDACAARIEAWWQRRIIDRPPVTIDVDAEFLAETFPLNRVSASAETTVALFGGKFLETSEGICALPLAATSRDIAGRQPNLVAAAWRQIISDLDDSLGRSRDRWITCMPDLYTGPDLLATLRGPENLCRDLIDDPDFVLAAAGRCQDAFEAMFDEAWGRLRAAGQPCCTAWTPLLHAGSAYPIGCDFANLISPAMFQRSLLPVLERAAGRLDRCLYHFDGQRSLAHLDSILALPRVQAIQWSYGPGEGPSSRWVDIYRRIQSAGKALQLVCDDLADARAVAAHLRPEGLWFCPQGRYTLSEAEAFIGGLR
jgi:hypothetical protein